MTNTPSIKTLELILIAFIIVFSFFVLNHQRTQNPYYFDEISWICEGRVWNEAIQGRFKSGIWQEDLVQRLNPQLSKLVLGWWMNVNFGEKGFSVYNCPTWGSLMHINGLENLSPLQQQMLFTMRIPMMWFGIMSLVLLFVMATVLFDFKIGVLSGLMLLFNPLFQTTVNRAMPDSMLLTWFILFMLVMAFMYKEFRPLKNQISGKTAFLFGLLLGIGTSIKPYGIYAYLPLVGFWFILLVSSFKDKNGQKLHNLFRFIWISALTLVVALAVIYALNPVFWTPGNTFLSWTADWRTFQYWLQTEDWAYKDIALFTPGSRLSHLVNSFIFPGKENLIFFHPLINILILVLGIILFLKISGKTKEKSGLLVLIWFFVMIGSLLFYTPFKLTRYYVAFLPTLVIIQSQGLYWTVTKILQLLQRKSQI